MKFIKLLNKAQFHGAKLLAESHCGCPLAVSFMIFLCSAITAVWVMIHRYFSDPTFIVKIETLGNPMMFPTVLVCPEISYPDYKMDEFVNKIKFPPSLNATYIRSVLKQFAAFASPDVVFNYEDLEMIQDLLDYNNMDIEVAGLRLTPSCEEILLRCQWRGNIVNCSSIFQMELARFGYCCVFNGRSLKREIREHGLHHKTSGKAVYVDDIGVKNALLVAVDQRKDLFDVDLVYKWVMIRTGQHFVDITLNGSAITPGEETWISYDTTTMQVSDDAASLSSDLRKCKMAYEPLKYFPTYHKTYCLLECEMKRTMERCNCLQISHPSLPGVPACRVNRLQCARSATVSFAIDECDCPVTCNVETENSELSTYDLISSSNSIDKFYEGLDLKHVSVIRVFVAKHHRNVRQRRSYFTTFNLFSQLGGVFNVFFGCSILTLLECQWRGNIVNCSSIFQMELARFGYCCVFNGRSLKREIREHGLHRKTSGRAVYVDDIGVKNALLVAVDQRKDLFDVDLVYKWVMIRTGQHFVDITLNGSAITPGEETWISYDTTTMQVSDDAASLSSDLRKCKMAYEPLKYFPTYHKTYCLLECEMKRTMEKCNCLQISHPSLPGVPACRVNRLQCARRATVSFAIDECDCPVTCNVETENSELSTYDLISNSDTIDKFYEGLDLKHVSVIRVFVAKHHRNVRQRRSYFTTFNLFSQLGGVFNVFFGCSILTLLELVMLAISAIRH